MSSSDPLERPTQSELELEILTGIHIGTGEEIDPLGYVVTPLDESGEAYLCRFQIDRVIPLLSDKGREALLELVEGNDLARLRKALAKTVSDIAAKGKPIWDYQVPASTGFEESYRYREADLEKQLLVKTMMRFPDSSPCIPGSSLKGAVRTGVLQTAVSNTPRAIEKRGQKLRLNEPVALGYRGAQADPFRAVKLPDVAITGRRNQLACEAKVWRPDSDTGSPDIFLEVLRGTLLDGDARATLRMSVDNRAFQAGARTETGRWGPPRVILDSRSLLRQTHQFYTDVFHREFEHFYLGADDSSAREPAARLKEIVDQLDGQREFLIRIGRLSQRESMTVHSGNVQFGRSRTLLAYKGQYIPAGWGIIRLREHQHTRPRAVARVRRSR